MNEAKPSKSQFMEYVKIRNSGVTNMFDINYIVTLSTTGLTKKNCFYIMEHFEELADEYNINI